MYNLVIKKRFTATTFGTWKWKKDDYTVPLSFQLDGARSQIYVKEDRFRDDPLQIVLHLVFVLIFEGAPKDYLQALRSRGKKSIQFAHRVYDYFVETLSRFEAVLRVSGKVRNLIPMGVPTIHSFYESGGLNGGEVVTWQVGKNEPQRFCAKLEGQPKGKSALFKHPQLVTVEKWKMLQEDIDANRIPPDDVVELHRLAGKVYPREKRLPVVEAAILIESKLKAYAEAILPKKGFSRSKIKDLKDELTFNTVLNLVLPLTLTKSELRRLKRWIPLVDRIRKLRNDIVHNALQEESIS
jgi:hypothetical protein